MAVANLIKALEDAEQRPEFKGKVKGYKVYGRLSEYTITDVDISEKARAGGVFALLSLRVFEHLPDQEYRKGMTGNVLEGAGTCLVYVPSEDYLGKDVVINLSKSTSLQRKYWGNSDTATILTWNRRKGSNEWEIIPTKVNLIQKQVRELEPYLSVVNGKVNYTRSKGIDGRQTINWKAKSARVSSSPKRLTVDKRVTDMKIWRDTSKTIANSTTDIREALASTKGILKLATEKQGRFLKKLVAKSRENEEFYREFAHRIIDSYLDACFQTWTANGKPTLYDLLEQLDDCTDSNDKRKAIRNLIYYLAKNGNDLPEQCKERFKKARITPNEPIMAVLMIAHIAGVSVSRAYTCMKRICNSAKAFRPEDCLQWMVCDPFLLVMLGASLRYNDCVKIQATICDSSQQPTAKPLLYAMDCYRDYTRRSNYRDTLITREEWVSAEELKRKDESVSNLQGQVYFKKAETEAIKSGVAQQQVPKEATEMPNIQDYQPITIDNVPRLGFLKKPFERVLEKLEINGLIFAVNSRYLIPTYEGLMELRIAERLCNNKEKEKLVLTSNSAQYIRNLGDLRGHVFISDSFAKGDGLTYEHKPKYEEPIYFCKLSHKKKPEPTGEKYIVGNIDNYSLWELSTLLDGISEESQILFLADKSQRPPDKGVSVLPFLQEIVTVETVGVDRNEYCTNMLTYNREVLSTYSKTEPNTIYALRKGEHFTIKRAVDLDFETEIEKLADKDWDDLQVITAGDGLERKINSRVSHRKHMNKEPLFTINGESFYQMEKVIFMGVTDKNLPRYGVPVKEGKKYKFEALSTKGIARRHTAEILGVVKASEAEFDGKAKMKYPASDVYVVLVIHDSILDQPATVLIRARRNNQTLELYGRGASQIAKGYAQDIKHMTRQTSKHIIIALDQTAKICRQDLASALSKAEDVTLLGDVGIQKSASGDAMEVIYPEQRRTLFVKLLEQGRKKCSEENRRNQKNRAS